MTPASPLSGPLSGLRAVSLATNLPGPVATALLRREGLHTTKVEPPAGDMLAQTAPELYAELAAGQEVQTLDLRSAEDWSHFSELLRHSDLLITSQRPAALGRLGITLDTLQTLNPQLCWVEIVGDKQEPDVPGHDLTYQLQAGLLRPPAMPLSLLADLSGAETAARAAVTLLLGRERGAAERWRRIGLRQGAEALTLPLRHGLTTPGGWLSGAEANYRLYAVQDGWAGLAALEPHFAARLDKVLAGRSPADWLAGLSAAEANQLAGALDLPLHAVGAGTEPAGPKTE
ncbi:CoA transferase [Deinococcus radiophilus]|uniref:CoA transferase n=1 Tax=Deinococcus radiophilus TaxID=32062 RepID=A0A3S0KHD6_9DEIO|nr:CoA transferase [Deinococcus radiophilus]RTR26826.1 CoA transferase [Deinococcus radiophilus]UFA51809.1 CoA transferase [Deinococcus radiophilus]